MNGSPPSVISDVIAKAVESKKPKRRYLVGANARPMIILRTWFGDGVFDALMLRFMKK